MKIQTEESVRGPRSFLSDLEPNLTLLKMWGLLPIYHEVKTKRERIISRLHRIFCLLFSILQISLLLTFIYIYVKDSQDLKESGSKLRVASQYMIDLFIACIGYCVVLTCCFTNASLINKIFSDLVNYDIQLKKYFPEFTTQNLQAFSIIILVWKLASYYIIFVDLKRSSDISNKTIIYYAVALIGFLSPILVIFLCVFMKVLAQRFKFLNLQLNNYVSLGPNRNITEEFKQKIVYEDLLFIIRSHSKLVDILQEFNRYSAMMLAGIFMNSFYAAVSYSYYFVVFWADNNFSLSLEYALIGVSHLRTTTVIALIAYSCEEAVNAANKTSTIIARIYTKNKEVYCLVDKYMSKSIKHRITYSVKEFFNVDGSILFKIFAAVTTYVIILIQFKQLEEKEEVTNMADPDPE